jgi:hypothetical protein
MTEYSSVNPVAVLDGSTQVLDFCLWHQADQTGRLHDVYF